MDRLIEPELRIVWRGGNTSTEGIPFNLQALSQAVGEMVLRDLPICFNDEFPFVQEVQLVIYRKAII